MSGTWTGVLAIDGPSGTGKSSVAREVAGQLGVRYLDTGAMYRAVTWAVLRQGVSLDDPDAVAGVVRGTAVSTGTDPSSEDIQVDGVHVETEIRSTEVTSAVSAVSAVPAVRVVLVGLQRQVISAGAMVVEGRDIGTVVVPNAALKVYLDASPEARTMRRARQHEVTDPAALAALARELRRRDEYDSARPTSPLRPAEDAVVLNTTDLTREQVVDHIVGLAERILRGSREDA